ncbi:MAG TPA: peptide ABC transporter substrate-binding protein, partial [Polyangiaceae bacterium]|nr:peptide ABC transporter substrate-binding protein [Polyangiaceae bacterium]
FINGAEPDTLDPHLNSGQPGGRIITALFEGLTRQDARSLLPAPGVAQAWDISPDGLTYTFHLRSDAVWSDGKALGPQDFVYSWRRMLDPALGAEYAYILYPIKGARAFNTFAGLADDIEREIVPELTRVWTSAPEIGLARRAWSELANHLNLTEVLQYSRAPAVRTLLEEPASSSAPVERERLRRFLQALPGEAARLRAEARDVTSRFGSSLGVYASDARTLVVELEAPTPYFLDLTSFYSALPVPRHAIEKWGDSWFLPETIVSNGPFELESWRVNDRVRLRRSERYWGRAEVHAESIEVLPTENTTTCLNLYLTGEADWLPSYYPKELAPELRQRPDFYAHPAFMVYYFRLNTRRPPLNDVRVRQALNLAIDRQVITERVLGLGELPADHFVPPGVRGYAAPPSQIRLDIGRAQQLLVDAGFPGGQGFPRLGLLYTSSESHRAIAEVITDQWKRNLGIDVVPYNQEWQAYLASSRSGNYDIARATWIGDYLDPNTFLDLWVTDGGNNQTGFSSAVYDELIRAAANMDRFALHPKELLDQLKEPAPVAALLERRSALTDAAERRELLGRARLRLLAEAEAILVQDQFPVLPVYFYVESGLYAHNVHGLYTELELPDGSHVPNLQDI